jgi:hypothetical protein
MAGTAGWRLYVDFRALRDVEEVFATNPEEQRYFATLRCFGGYDFNSGNQWRFQGTADPLGNLNERSKIRRPGRARQG